MPASDHSNQAPLRAMAISNMITGGLWVWNPNTKERKQGEANQKSFPLKVYLSQSFPAISYPSMTRVRESAETKIN